MIPDLILGQVVFVFGPVASGKTFLLTQWAEKEEHVLLFDTAGDHLDNGAFEHIFNNPRALADRMADARMEDSYRLAYHPQNVEEGFDWCMSTIWQRDEPRWFILEEIHELMNSWTQHPKMKVLNKYARKRASLGVIGSSQRIADVHKDFTSAARMSILFFSTEATDLKAISERYGSEVADAVRGLRPLLYDDASGTTSQIPEAVVWKRGQGWEVMEIGHGSARVVRHATHADSEEAPASEAEK